MDGEKRKLLIPGLIAVLILTAAAGFYTGKYTESKKYREEHAAHVAVNRSDLEGLGDIEGTIYVTGHKVPDSDAVGSAIAYAALLQKLGYEAKPVVLGKINNETEFILETAGVKTPDLLEDASGCNVVLVDHDDYSQSADGLKDAHVISTIDHHGDGTVTTANQIIYDGRPLGATATIVWIRYRDYDVEIDKPTAIVMLGAILSDTGNLRYDTTTEADREAVKALSELAGIEDTDAFFREEYKASVSHDGMTDEEIFYSDYKEYDAGGKKYAIACISVYNEEDAKDMEKRMKDYMPSTLIPTGMDMAFTQISIFHDDINVAYIVPCDDTAAEVIEACFGDGAEYDGTAYVLKPGISRKRDLVPAINGVLEAHPQE